MTSEEMHPSAALLVLETSSLFSFNQALITIGRTNDNDLVIGHANVSRKHAEIRFTHGEFEILDLGSTGGTYVNGEKVDRCTLSKGDVITLANVHLVFGKDNFPVAKSTFKYKLPEEIDQTSNDTTIIHRGPKIA